MTAIVVSVSFTSTFSITTPLFFMKNVTRTPKAIFIFITSGGFASLGESVLFGGKVDHILSST
jgi:hypothetical protein